MTREEVWLRAWCAVASTINGKEPDCLRYADACLKAFDERFPETKLEPLWAGKPLSELNETERAEMKRPRVRFDMRMPALSNGWME